MTSASTAIRYQGLGTQPTQKTPTTPAIVNYTYRGLLSKNATLLKRSLQLPIS